MDKASKRIMIQSLKLQEKELQQELEYVRKLIQKNQNELNIIGEPASANGNDMPLDLGSQIVYNPNWSNLRKAHYFLQREGRFLHIREMSEMAHECEHNIGVAVFTRKFSSALANLKRQGKVVSYQHDKSLRNVFWGSPTWLDENKKIKRGYEFNKKYLLTSDKDKFILE